MGIVNPKYKQLKPEFNYLADEVILAQAWKKSHSYIRSHSWYADTLELDSSAVNLEKNLKYLSQELLDLSYRPIEMKMVLAPKTDHWTFFDLEGNGEWEWGPKPGEDGTPKIKELRPLAHINIRDQTVATAIMLCLADAVETAQGSTEPEKGHKVWSYGNRLFCDWNDKQAKFRWGNSSTYSKYFQDYQRFLDRPIIKAKDLQNHLSFSESIYEIHLDLSAFFDSINKDSLIRKLKFIASKHYETDKKDNELFWKIVNIAIDGWTWRQEDRELSCCLKKNELNNNEGLPQGLVASGFFANAYLISLDNRMSRLLEKQLGQVTLIDYCRYVDDIRLLVHAPIDNNLNWKEWVEKCIEPVIVKTRGLNLNLQKTKVERFTAKRSGVSVRMKGIQNAASGPQDMTALNDMQGALEGLITLAEQFKDQETLPYADCDIALAKIDQPQMDVREDTLLRFAANRLTVALSKKRAFAIIDNGNSESISELDHVCESFARRFIAAWSRNPSLIAILKKGIQLFPHILLLKPAVDALTTKLFLKNETNRHEYINEHYIAAYCLSEIYRFAALILHRQDPDKMPKHSDCKALIDYLIHIARELGDEYQVPWYLWQQIALFMAVNEEPCSLPEIEELIEYRSLLRILQGDRRFAWKNAVETRLPLYLIAYQISSRRQKVVSNLSDWLTWLFVKQNKKRIATSVIASMALNHPDLFEIFLRHGKQIQAKWVLKAEVLNRALGISISPISGKLSKLNSKNISLARIIKRDDNPFADENALLNLAVAALDLLGKLDEFEQFTPHCLGVTCKDWSCISCPDISGNLGLTLILEKDAPEDVRFIQPTWLSEDEDSIEMYALGAFLRSCATGFIDFTASQYLVRENTTHAYWGFKSSWFKRRIGMAHQPEALAGHAAPMSSWISELLYRLLQWPGLEVRNYEDEWPEQLSLKTLKQLLLTRTKEQHELYGKSSNLPIYVERIHHNIKNDGHLKIVMAQSVLPKKSDFLNFGSRLEDPEYRARHSNHISTISKLICQKLEAINQAEGKESIKPLADLIIFPELSVHEKDIGILKQLADKTGAMIFCGLVFRQHGNDLINTALWLIPFKNGHGRQWIMRYQGKKNMTVLEKNANIQPWRNYQLVIELVNTLKNQKHGFRLSGSICYDATDISLAADLKNITNTFIVSALNQDIDTFDTMIDALHYHMYQPVVLVNTGEFGGSAAKAPYKEKYHKQIAHIHGNNQIAISMFMLNMYDFSGQPPELGSGKEKKTAPAGMKRGAH
jgi:hypothetical protein